MDLSYKIACFLTKKSATLLQDLSKSFSETDFYQKQKEKVDKKFSHKIFEIEEKIKHDGGIKKDFIKELGDMELYTTLIDTTNLKIVYIIKNQQIVFAYLKWNVEKENVDIYPLFSYNDLEADLPSACRDCNFPSYFNCKKAIQ